MVMSLRWTGWTPDRAGVMQKRQRWTGIDYRRPRRRGVCVWALFGRRRGKNKQKEEALAERERVVEVLEKEKEVEEVPERVMHQSVEVQSPVWKQALHNQNFGPVVMGGVFTSLALYVMYLVVFKCGEAIERIEFDLNNVMTQLQKLKEMRMQPDMSDSDVIRVRSFLLSLIIKRKKHDPAKVINDALTLLNDRHLNAQEKQVLLGIKEPVESAVKGSSGPMPDLQDLRMLEDVLYLDDLPLSSAYDPEASVHWWHKLPYICVLQMKKTKALFMVAVPEKGPDAFALLGFEDPEEAFHAGKMPVHQQRWGVLSQMRLKGIKPSRPLEDEKHFDLTWLQPKEFNALMDSAGCYGVVIPAGTLRYAETARPIPVSQIMPAIAEICSDEKIGATDARPMELMECDGDADPSEASTNGASDPWTDHRNPSVGDSRAERSSSVSNGDLSNGHSQMPVSEIHQPISNAVAGDLRTNRRRKDSNTRLNATPASSSNASPTNATTPQDSDSTEEKPWWMELESVVVPKIKPAGQEGGNVEINISVNPEVNDFRAVLFEDEREAKFFLGILGKLHGPETLVAAIRQSPSEFLLENSKLDKSQIVCLCTGALLMNRDADTEGLRMAVRLAHVATEIKKGVSYAPEQGADDSFDERAMKVAKDVVSKFKDRMDANARAQRQEGDDGYLDPVEGMLHDLETGGLDDLFGSRNDDGMSAEVGEERNPFPGLDVEKDDGMDSLYAKFVAQMSQNIDKAQQDIRSRPVDLSDPPPANDVELDASLDDLIDKKAVEEEKEGEDDGIEVVYPDQVRPGETHKMGRLWFSDLKVIYMPEFLTVEGESSYLAFTDANQNRLVVGFQDRAEARLCKEMMKTWPRRQNVAAGIESVAPQDVIDFCQENDATPVIIRRNLLAMSLHMSQYDFLNQVALIAQTQATDYQIFNG